MTTERDPMLDDYTLSDGREVKVRKLSASVVKAMIEDRHKRGYEDLTMDAFVAVPLVLKDTAGNAVDEAFIESMLLSDVLGVWSKANGVDSPNASAPSSDGTQPEEKARKVGRGSLQPNG